jgi:hypothetical protein
VLSRAFYFVFDIVEQPQRLQFQAVQLITVSYEDSKELTYMVTAYRRTSVPGTGGQFAERDAKTYARSLEGASRTEIACEFKLSAERIRTILNHQRRLGELCQLPWRVEAFVREQIGQEHGEITPALVAAKITMSDLKNVPWLIKEPIIAFTKNAGFKLRT